MATTIAKQVGAAFSARPSAGGKKGNTIAKGNKGDSGHEKSEQHLVREAECLAVASLAPGEGVDGGLGGEGMIDLGKSAAGQIETDLAP